MPLCQCLPPGQADRHKLLANVVHWQASIVINNLNVVDLQVQSAPPSLVLPELLKEVHLPNVTGNFSSATDQQLPRLIKPKATGKMKASLQASGSLAD